MEPFIAYLYRVFLYSFPIISIILPFFLIAFWQTQTAQRLMVVQKTSIVLIFIVVNEASLLAPRLQLFSTLHWNWQGKIIDVIWVITFLHFYRRLSASEMALTHKLKPDSLRPVVIVTLVATFIPIVFFVFGVETQQILRLYCFK